MKLWFVALALVACSDHDRTDRMAAQSEAPRQRRVIEPPVGVVRALPPHAIRANSVGPYKLCEKLSDLLEQLPSGPRLALFEVPGLLHRSLIRAEDNAVLIGGEPQGTATFVAVVGPDVARTESGIHVGSTRAELVSALGPPVEEFDRAHDPRLVIPSGLRSARVLFAADRIAAIAIVGEPAPGPVPSRDDCPRPASTEKALGACLTGAGELVEFNDNEFSLRLPDAEKPMGTFKVPNILFAAPLRAPDGKDELIVITRGSDDAQLRSWSLLAFRFDNGKLTTSIDPTPLYKVSSSNARWIGAEVGDIDLYLELTSRRDTIEVGGLLTTRPQNEAMRDVVVISTMTVPRRRAKPAGSEASGAEPPDAGTTVHDGAGTDEGSGGGSGSAGRAKP
ncbi:hypothetical protein BH11MYX3_BH11MYX3_29570 [soil metagenome]